ncbi:MAG TPA: squalene/phytoene synthase family protein [Caulobacteraceae bacterium]|nr:squalene/phytoene synthase family protein [Caulobacteraceae bacterium]
MTEDDPSDLDALVSRADPDRWAAARFVADPAERTDVIALYAFNHELARVAGSVTNTLTGEIRLAWWREALDEAFAEGAVRAHPTAQALAQAIRRRQLERATLEAMIDARAVELYGEPLTDEAAVFSYLDGTAGALAISTASVLAPQTDPQVLRAAARAWGLAGLFRNRGAGRKGPPPADWSDAEVRERVAALVRQARGELKRLPVPAFPAIAYATFAKPYAAGRELSEPAKRLRLTAAVALGRI